MCEIEKNKWDTDQTGILCAQKIVTKETATQKGGNRHRNQGKEKSSKTFFCYSRFGDSWGLLDTTSVSKLSVDWSVFVWRYMTSVRYKKILVCFCFYCIHFPTVNFLLVTQ